MENDPLIMIQKLLVQINEYATSIISKIKFAQNYLTKIYKKDNLYSNKLNQLMNEMTNLINMNSIKNII